MPGGSYLFFKPDKNFGWKFSTLNSNGYLQDIYISGKKKELTQIIPVFIFSIKYSDMIINPTSKIVNVGVKLKLNLKLEAKLTSSAETSNLLGGGGISFLQCYGKHDITQRQIIIKLTPFDVKTLMKSVYIWKKGVRHFYV